MFIPACVFSHAGWGTVPTDSAALWARSMAEETNSRQPDPRRDDLATLLAAMRCLKWLSDSPSQAIVPVEMDCLLRTAMLQPVQWQPQWSDLIARLLELGVELRGSWSRPWDQSVEHWLGRRFYLSHAANFHASTRWASLVSSQLGRGGTSLPTWPSMLDSVLRNIDKQKGTVLLVPSTTLAETSKQFADLAGLRNATLILPATKLSFEKWLLQSLERLGSAEHERCMRHEIYVSPLLPDAQMVSDMRGLPAVPLADSPLPDRAAISLADSVFVVSVRPKGNIEKLIRRRLDDSAFPKATVFVNMSHLLSEFPDRQRDPSDKLRAWLDRGAVGWVVPLPLLGSRSMVSGCRLQGEVQIATQQLCTALPPRWELAQEEWSFLSHCTRGDSGPLPDESLARYRQRLWIEGQVACNHPIVTLHHICQEGRLRGTSRITRTNQRLVCFSAVPLPQLLKRRTFRSHLGRWDWEPFGLVIDRAVLQRLGAQPVLYGSEEHYNALPHEQRAFFQPRGSDTQHADSGWEMEREWRVLGDVDLKELPRQSIRLFVRTREEAFWMSRRYSWAVIWTENSRA